MPAEGLFLRLAMLQMGNRGNTQAHMFLEDVARSPLSTPEQVQYRIRHGSRVFVPSTDIDRVVMFPDKSGAYVHHDGLCTIMSEDISHEIGAWREVTP